MRRLALLLLLAVPAPAGAAPVCGPAEARTMAAGELTRVYVRRHEAYACTRGVRARRHLGNTYCYGSSSGCETVDDAAVGGRFFAYAVQACCDSYGDAYFDLVVRHAGTGRMRERHDVGEISTTNAYIKRIVLRQSGAAAWLWRRVDRQGESHVVSRSPRCGEPATLAEAPAIARFRRDGARVRWREGGTDRSAPLC